MSRARAHWQALPPFTQDVIFACALTTIALLEVTWWERGTGSLGATVGGVLGLGIGVALRRRNTMLALVIADLSIVAQAALDGFLLENSFSPILMPVVVAYSLGAYVAPPMLWVGTGLQAAGFTALGLLSNGNKAGNVFFGILLACVLPIVSGVMIRRRRALVAELGARQRQLVAERERTARGAVAAERARIAGELHDVVSHNVSVMVVQAGAARRLIKTDAARASEAMLAIENTGRAALDEMRRLLGVLRRGDEELALAPQPTLRRVEHLVNLARALGLDARLHVEGDEVSLPLGLDVAAYRIIQEALDSAQAHAPGARADVVVRYRPSELELEVVNGPPAVGDEVKAPSVLVGLRERVALFGGDLYAGRRRGGGYTLRAKLPLAESAS